MPPILLPSLKCIIKQLHCGGILQKKAKQRKALLSQVAASVGGVRSIAQYSGALNAEWESKDLLNTWRPMDQTPTKQLELQWGGKA